MVNFLCPPDDVENFERKFMKNEKKKRQFYKYGDRFGNFYVYFSTKEMWILDNPRECMMLFDRCYSYQRYINNYNTNTFETLMKTPDWTFMFHKCRFTWDHYVEAMVKIFNILKIKKPFKSGSRYVIKDRKSRNVVFFTVNQNERCIYHLPSELFKILVRLDMPSKRRKAYYEDKVPLITLIDFNTYARSDDNKLMVDPTFTYNWIDNFKCVIDWSFNII
jgi:hypothetical protein